MLELIQKAKVFEHYQGRKLGDLDLEALYEHLSSQNSRRLLIPKVKLKTLTVTDLYYWQGP